MYLYLGQDTVVPMKDVIGVFDMENTTVSKHTRQFLSDAQKGGRVETVSPDLPKSFVVCVSKKEKEETVYISQLSVATLRGRARRERKNHG